MGKNSFKFSVKRTLPIVGTISLVGAGAIFESLHYDFGFFSLQEKIIPFTISLPTDHYHTPTYSPIVHRISVVAGASDSTNISGELGVSSPDWPVRSL